MSEDVEYIIHHRTYNIFFALTWQDNFGIHMPDILKDKSFSFSLSIIKLYSHLCSAKKEYVLSKQLLRSGTSVGALVREAGNAESKADFIHKLGIAQKECDESLYWLELLFASGFLTKDHYDQLHEPANEIFRIIRSSILTAKQNLKK